MVRNLPCLREILKVLRNKKAGHCLRILFLVFHGAILTFQTTSHITSSFAEISIHFEVATCIVCHYEKVMSSEREDVDSNLLPRSFWNFM